VAPAAAAWDTLSPACTTIGFCFFQLIESLSLHSRAPQICLKAGRNTKASLHWQAQSKTTLSNKK
jgi:hypothetical protein